MSERLADIVTQIRNVRQLEAVVTAMRGLAASRAQMARAQLPGVAAYSEVVSRAIGQALALVPADGAPAVRPVRERPGLLVFGAEQGFAGAFGARVLAAIASDQGRATTLIVGTRAAAVAAEHGIAAAWSSTMPTRADAVPAFAGRLVERVYRFFAAGAMTRLDIVFTRIAAGGTVRIDRDALLPVDLGRFAVPPGDRRPLTTLAPEVLVERLAAEYVYARICEAAMHALEAENEARMLAMTSARNNIGGKLGALQARERQLRQQEITTEIIELVAGAGTLARR